MKTNFETMLKWLLSDIINLHKGKGEITEEAIIELEVLLNDEEKMECIQAYFNALMYTDVAFMIGHEDTDDMFESTVKRYPALCRVLKVYVYA
jgi:hypothetical protein